MNDEPLKPTTEQISVEAHEKAHILAGLNNQKERYKHLVSNQDYVTGVVPKETVKAEHGGPLYGPVDIPDDEVVARDIADHFDASLLESIRERAARALFWPEGFEDLGDILEDVMEQASEGKGQERHANNKAWLEQPWVDITRDVGTGFLYGQALKKIRESLSFTPERRRHELLGAIHYLAMGIHYESGGE